jgi:glycosyltransferase involved in cell wall biosynthesis
MSACVAPPVFLICGRDPFHTAGGSESYAVAQARATVLAGYEPHLFSIAARAEELTTDFGVLHRVASPVRPPRSILSPLQRPWLVPAIVETVEGLAPRGPGPILLHSFGAWSVSAANAAARLRRRGANAIPLTTVFTALEHETRAKLESTVVRNNLLWRTFHRGELVWTRRVMTAVEGRALHQMRAVIVNYDSVARQLAAYYGDDPPLRRLTYTSATAFESRHEPPAVPEEPALPEAPALPEPLRGFGDPDAPLIVSVSRHDGRKGLDTLIGALTLLRDDGVAFRACLVGPGILLGAHRKLVRRVGLEDRVVVPGRVDDPMAYLRAADVFVLPSLQEGSGSVSLLEALQTGVASVVSDVDGLPEDVTHEDDALLVQPGHQRALAQAVRRLIEDPELRGRLGDSARRTFERRFAPEVFALEMHRYEERPGLDAALGKAVTQLVAGDPEPVGDRDPKHPRHAPRDGGRKSEALDSAEGDAVALVVASPAFDELGQSLGLGERHRSLKVRHPVVEAQLPVPEMPVGAKRVTAKRAGRLGHMLVVRRDDAALAARDDLVSVQGECGHVAEAADRPPAQIGAVGLGGVLHEEKPVALGEVPQGIHVGRLPVNVDSQDRACSRCQLRGHARGIEVPRQRISIDEDGPCAEVTRRVRGPDHGERGHDDLVADRDSGGCESEMQRRGPARARDGKPAADGPRELGLEPSHERPG